MQTIYMSKLKHLYFDLNQSKHKVDFQKSGQIIEGSSKSKKN